MGKQKAKPAPKKKRLDTGRRRAAWLLLLLGIPVVAGLILTAIPKKPPTAQGPRFQKEGELQILDAEAGDKVLASIDIEIASDDLERTRGLMWRREMEDNQGMLFIMEKNEPQSFWMLNTYLALDILFIGEDRRVVAIAPNAKPQSLDPVSSGTESARYVLEVMAGFSARKGVEVGDSIVFSRF